MSSSASKWKFAGACCAAASAALALALFAAANYGGDATGYARYVPSEPVAREALDLALAAWKRGEPIGPLQLASAPVAIEVADSQRRSGRRLADYEIVGEISGEGPRSFSVRLVFDPPRRDERVRYYLVGIDPLWVFQQRDYDAVIHWEACDDDLLDDPQAETAAAIR